MNAIITTTNALPAVEAESVRRYLDAGLSDSTRRAYRADMTIFVAWCDGRGLPPLPSAPGTVALFLSAEADAGVKPSTITRRLAAIKFAHEAAGLDSPTVHKDVVAVMRGIRREKGNAPVKKRAATAEVVKEMVRNCPDTLTGKRDRALLLLGFAGAFRRSELVALEVSDLEEVNGGLRVTIRKSKTDQEGAGQVIAVPRGGLFCPVQAVLDWLGAAGIDAGPVFRGVGKGGRVGAGALSDKSVADLVKSYAGKIGLDGAEFGAHSLRAGFVTSAAEGGASIFKMAEVSRHKSTDVLAGYVRSANLFKDHAGAGLL